MKDKEKIKFWFETSDRTIAESLAREMGVELHEMSARRWSRFGKTCGEGFGDHVWRVNYKMNGIEASFSKACSESAELKRNGFRWNHNAGVWYAKNEQKNADVCEKLMLRQVEAVTL